MRTVTLVLVLWLGVHGAVWKGVLPNAYERDYFNISTWDWAPADATDYCLSMWMRPSNPTTPEFNIVRFISTQSQALGFLWDDASEAKIIVDGGAEASLTTMGTLVLDKWYYVALGFAGTTTYLVITKRDTTSPFQDSVTLTANAPYSPNSIEIHFQYRQFEFFTRVITELELKVGEGITENSALNLVYQTFLCGQTSGGCLPCHPSCGGECDADDNCAACAAVSASVQTDYPACKCDDDTVIADDYGTSCVSCHWSCAACSEPGDSTKCTQCHFQTVPSTVVGECLCPAGYMTEKLSPEAECATPCDNCDYCASDDLAQCFKSAEQLYYVKGIYNSWGLPLSLENENHRMCYYQTRPTTGCTPDPVEAVVDTIDSYGTLGEARPLESQCLKWLQTMWPVANYHFDTLFSIYTPPAVSDLSVMEIKAEIYLWILGFGAASFRSEEWTDLMTLFNDAATNWNNVFAWVNLDTSAAEPVYSGNYMTAGTHASEKSLPQSLIDWLAMVCPDGVTENCKHLSPFNAASTVCRYSTCHVQSTCSSALGSGSCAANGDNDS